MNPRGSGSEVGRRGRLAGLAGRLLLLLLGIGFALLAAEVVLRLLPERAAPTAPEAEPALHPESRAAPDLSGLPELRGVLQLARPNVRGVYKDVLYRTNRWGVRGPEIAIPKPPGVFRIVVIGDSVTMGSGVREEDAYPAQLERLLGARRSDRRFEVLNLGIGGLNLRVSVNRLAKIGLRFEPDLVVYGATLNDVEGRHYRRTLGANLLRRWAGSRSRLLQLVGARWRSLRDLFWPDPDSYVYELDENYFRNPEAWSDYLTALDRLAAIVREQEICGCVFQHAVTYALGRLHPFHRHYVAVAEAAAARELFVISSFPFFAGQDGSRFHVAPLDPHPNVEGHRVLAQALLEGLEALPDRCWQRAGGR